MLPVVASREVSGWPDRLYVSPGGAITWVEWKRGRNRRLTPRQSATARILVRRGQVVLVARILEDGRVEVRAPAELLPRESLPEGLREEYEEVSEVGRVEDVDVMIEVITTTASELLSESSRRLRRRDRFVGDSSGLTVRDPEEPRGAPG